MARRDPTAVPLDESARELLHDLAMVSRLVHRVRDLRGVHLADLRGRADFATARALLVGVARFAVNELDAAGALDDPPTRPALRLLDGGK